MKKVISKGIFPLSIFMAVWVPLALVLLNFTKAEIHLYINRFHSGFWDYVFKNITNLGDGLVPLILFLIFLFFSYRKALIVGLSGLFAGIIAQLLKRFVFPDVPRPKVFFEGIANLYLVPGVDVHSSFSFPSGHAATVFSLFFVLAYFTNRKILQILLLFLALLTGYSRMYLSQHFLIDVYFGGLIGICASLAIIYFIEKLNNNWIDKSLLMHFKKET